MPTMDDLGQRPDPPQWYVEALAQEKLKNHAYSRTFLSGDELDYFDFEHREWATETAQEANVQMAVPQGKPNPQWRQHIEARIQELRTQLSDDGTLSDDEKTAINDEIQELLAEAAVLQQAGG